MTVSIPEEIVKKMTSVAMALQLQATLQIQVSEKLGYEGTV